MTLKSIRNIIFPFFNPAHILLLCALILFLGLIAVFDDPLLALHLGVGAYLGIVICTYFMGLAPDQIEIGEDQIAQISDLLTVAPFVVPVGERVWAPVSSRSSLFRSDWISIEEVETNKFVLNARKRDIKNILAEMRSGGGG